MPRRSSGYLGCMSRIWTSCQSVSGFQVGRVLWRERVGIYGSVDFCGDARLSCLQPNCSLLGIALHPRGRWPTTLKPLVRTDADPRGERICVYARDQPNCGLAQTVAALAILRQRGLDVQLCWLAPMMDI